MEKKYQEYMLTALEKLLSIDSPSGYTRGVEDWLLSELKALGYSPARPVKGGALCRLGGEGDALLLLSHVDTLGAMVCSILDNGRLRLTRIGGLQPGNVETETVRVITRFGGTYEGTIQLMNASAHVNPKMNVVRSFDENLEVVLDEDVKSPEDTRALGIEAGDIVAVEPRFKVTSKGYVKSRFLDDKASAAVLLSFAKYLHDEKIMPSRAVSIGFTIQEEIGYGGAANIPADTSEVMSVDMGCVGDGLTCTERQVSICAKDSGGPYNYDCTTALIKAAKEAGLDYAVDTYPSYSSDVEVTLRAGHDVRHCLIGPGVYASHGYERTHIDGLKNTFDLLCAYIMK
ncbi:MAG: M42 family metallopeptidase [Clostridiaceae bacterium]|nr:M42 family metallopeptidase [Clostridiaceae bacterium]